MAAIVSDDVFQQFTNEVSRKQYQRTWSQFVDFFGDFDLVILSNYFKFLRLEKKNVVIFSVDYFLLFE